MTPPLRIVWKRICGLIIITSCLSQAFEVQGSLASEEMLQTLYKFLLSQVYTVHV